MTVKTTARIDFTKLREDVRKQTAEGLESFVAAAKKATERPERAAYLGGAAANTLGIGLGRLIAAPALAYDAWKNRGKSQEEETTAGATAAAVTAGAVAQREQEKRPNKPTFGMIALTAQYGIYAWLLQRRGARLSRETVVPRAAAWGAGLLLAGVRAPKLFAPVLISGAAVSTTSALANDPALQDGSLAARGLSHAGNLALGVQGIVLLRQTLITFGGPIGWSLDSTGRAADAVAQLLFVEGLNRR